MHLLPNQRRNKRNRSEIYTGILKDKESLLRLNEKKIAGILGLPDANELSRRNQKFFIYSINPGRECKGYNETDELYLIVRFNAVGLSSEIFIQETPGPF